MQKPGLHWPKATVYFSPDDDTLFQLDCSGVNLQRLELTFERILEMIKDGSLVEEPGIKTRKPSEELEDFL